MKIKLISTLGILFLLFALLPSAQATPALAQTCTDAAGGVIPCPTEEPQTDEEGTDSGGGSNPAQPELLFLGANENYLDPANWNNGGRIPGADDSARLDGLTAVIDPLDPTPIPLGNLTLRNGARLIVRDAVLQFDTLDSEGSILEFFNSYIKVNTFIDPPWGGFSLNPSFLEAGRIVLYKPETQARFGLGGDQPASADGRGPGHYARMQGNSIDLDGQLNLFFVYGFRPQPGNTFEIITNTGGNPINGFFANAPEGAVLGGFCDVQFRITYVGGDGNDVVLTTEERTEPDPDCSEDFSKNGSIGNGGNVLLDFTTIDLEPDQPIEVQDIQLVNNAEWNLYNGIVTARIVDSTNSTINLFNSHLKTEIFIDPLLGGYSLNPSFLEAERIVLYKPETPARFGLGGDQPASAEALGAGHYARMQGALIDLDGQLELFLVYGFLPDPGDTFEIITNTGGSPIHGTFANAPEGGIVSGLCNIQFRITYTGGDGNDVVLTAEERTEPDPLCDETFENPSPEKNVLLNASSLDLEPAAPLQAKDLILRDNAQLNLRNGSLTARNVDSSNSALNLFNFHLKADTVAPGPFGGFNLNPSFLQAERMEIDSSETISSFGIGGTEQAGENKLGKGHYAHLQADRIRLNGKLEIFFVYGFIPQPGQTFQIITANRARLGEFENAPEGSVVGGYCDVELVISYIGGDGNDVTLTAQKSANPNPEWECGSTSEPQPEPAQESNNPANLTPYLIGGAVLVLIVLLAIFLRKRSA